MAHHTGIFNMAIITPSPNFIREEEVRYKAAISEATFTKIGGSINYILSRVESFIDVDLSGYYFLNSYSVNGIGGLRYFKTTVDISSYYLSNVIAGTSGNLSLNFDVFDENGSLLGSLFSIAPSIASTAGGNSIIGRDVQLSQDINAGPGKIAGVLNFTTLLAGYSIKAKLLSVQINGANAFFSMTVKNV